MNASELQTIKRLDALEKRVNDELAKAKPKAAKTKPAKAPAKETK
jgi:hypothetical protein